MGATTGQGGTTVGSPTLTSHRALCAVVVVVAGYLAMAVISGVPNSPLTVLLPDGATPPAWARGLARAVLLDHVGRPTLIGVSLVLAVVVLAAFAVVVREAFAQRISLPVVLVASAVSLAIASAAPLMLSRDVYTYAAYGRIHVVYHHNPYVFRLASFPHDPFVAVASSQWRHTYSPYGPLFTLLSGAIAKTWSGSVDGAILAFKLVAGLSVAVATGLAAWTARRVRPGRAALAAALVGLNPVIVIHTVGGGHVDALIAAPLAAAMAIAVTRPRGATARGLAVTALLTCACLVKSVMAPALLLWLWWLVRTGRVPRTRALAAHMAVIAGLIVATVSPFIAGWHTLAPFATAGGLEQWASPSQFVAHGAHATVHFLAGAHAASDAATVTKAGFVVLFAVLLWRLARTMDESDPSAPPGAWGVALLLLALCMPFLLPWYALWFAPFLGIIADDAIAVGGIITTGVLALTLIPADPFHGYSTPGVMNGVHYAAAPVLLVVLVVIARRVLTAGPAPAGPSWPTSAATREGDELGAATAG